MAENKSSIINPVIRGFAPDPSIVRHDAGYVVATSSFEWFPTIPLFHSSDLSSWTFIGSVETAVPGRSLHGVPDSGGVWAPSLSISEGLWWVTYSIVRAVGQQTFDLETYVTTAKGPAGPWREPVRVPGHGFDPSLYHEAGRHYLLNLQNDHRPDGRRFAGIVLQELAIDAGRDGLPDIRTIRQAGRPTLLCQSEELIEGPKLIFHDGWYILLVAEGGTGTQHAVRAARSRHLRGPYVFDSQLLLTSRDAPEAPLQKAGHGELVRSLTGDWFLAHLIARPVVTPRGPRSVLGRETAIQPITWDDDGWPRLLDGGRRPAVQVHGDTVKSTPPEIAAGSDDGSAPSPDWPWSSPREPIGDWADFTARPGWTRLRGRNATGSWWNQSLIGRRLTEHAGRVGVTVDAKPTTFTESAGLVIYYNSKAFFELHVTWSEPDDEQQRGQQWQEPREGQRVITLVRRDHTGTARLARRPAPTGDVRLEAEFAGDTIRFLAGTPENLESVGDSADLSELSDDVNGELRFTGTLAGLNAVDLVSATFTADFADWDFQMRAQPPWDGTDTNLPAPGHTGHLRRKGEK